MAIGSLLRTAPLRTHTPTQLRWRDKIVDKASVCQRALRKPPLFQNYYQRVSKLLQRIMPCTYRRKHVIVDIGCQTKYSRTGGDIMSGKCPEWRPENVRSTYISIYNFVSQLFLENLNWTL